MMRSFESTRIKKDIDDILADHKNAFTQGTGANMTVVDSDSDESTIVGDLEKVKV